jgi:hypothetical protein
MPSYLSPAFAAWVSALDQRPVMERRSRNESLTEYFANRSSH